jgi:hypothetical protein
VLTIDDSLSWNLWGFSHQKNMIWLKINEICQMKGAYLMSLKLKICKCIFYACLIVIWLANSGSIELCETIYQLNFIYLCNSYFLSTKVQSYQRNICETKQTLWHVSRLILRQVSYLISPWDTTSVRQASKISAIYSKVNYLSHVRP